MLPWMATSTISIDIQQETAHPSMIQSTFFPNHKLMKLGNRLILPANILHDNTRLLCLMKWLINVRLCTKQHMATSRKWRWIALTTPALWRSFVVMTSPSFFTNIDTPGEQQTYSVALIEHFFSLIPLQCNVVILYDIGCVLACLLMKVCIYPFYLVHFH